jgi:single-strand selective monofunctional uracil DNA glycosylase
MTASGKNVTPPELKSTAAGGSILRNQLIRRCDAALLRITRLLGTELVFCVGKFAHVRALALVKEHQLPLRAVFLMHPSPINPLANRGWREAALKSLQETELLTDLAQQW